MIGNELEKAKIVIGNLSIELQVTKESLELYKKWYNEEEVKNKKKDDLLTSANNMIESFKENIETLEIEREELEKTIVNLKSKNVKK